MKVNGRYPNALSLLGDLELKNDDWVKAKETFRAASDATDGKDSYATLSLVCAYYIIVPCILFFSFKISIHMPLMHATPYLDKKKIISLPWL